MDFNFLSRIFWISWVDLLEGLRVTFGGSHSLSWEFLVISAQRLIFLFGVNSISIYKSLVKCRLFPKYLQTPDMWGQIPCPCVSLDYRTYVPEFPEGAEGVRRGNCLTTTTAPGAVLPVCGRQLEAAAVLLLLQLRHTAAAAGGQSEYTVTHTRRGQEAGQDSGRMTEPAVDGMPPCVALPLPPAQLEELVEKAKDYALMHGQLPPTL
jgi:hypothetical protein